MRIKNGYVPIETKGSSDADTINTTFYKKEHINSVMRYIEDNLTLELDTKLLSKLTNYF